MGIKLILAYSKIESYPEIMDKLSDYNSLEDFWLDLTAFTDTLWRYSDSSSLPPNLREETSKSRRCITFASDNTDKTLLAKLYTQEWEPSWLRVSQKIDRVHGFGATVLRLVDEYEPEENRFMTVGSVIVSGYPLRNQRDYRILDISDIPEKSQDVINRGLELLQGDIEF
jgi:hypothetical protein